MTHSQRPPRRLSLECLESRRVLAANASLIKDINTSLSFNSGASDPAGFEVVGSKVFFAASTLTHGRELWVSDGTTAGTKLVKNINPLATSSNPENLTNVNGTLYFVADNGTPGVELWKSDGTAAGTVLVKDLPDTNPVTPPRELTAVGSKLYFFRGGGFTSGRELWVSNGTPGGTKILKAFEASLPALPPRGVIAYKNQLFFAAASGAEGMELWKSNGTVAGTVLAADIAPNDGFGFSSSPGNFAVLNGSLYFSAFQPNFGFELWKSDGTQAGTSMVKDIAPDTGSSSPGEITVVGGKLFFATGIGGNSQLYKSNGTGPGTVQLKDFGAPLGLGSSLRNLTAVGSTLCFNGYDATHGNGELWKSDGTPNGTKIVEDIAAGPAASDPQYLTNVNGRLFFRLANDDLWFSDGTVPGTYLVGDSTASFLESPPKDMAAVDGMLYFAMKDTTHARELWRALPSVRPVLTVPTSASYTENANATVLAPQGTIVDGDSPNFGGGSLAVAILANSSTNDRLTIRNQGTAAGKIGVSGSNVTFGGVVIGTFSGGSGATPLVVNFNASATKAAAQALLRNILFRTLGSNPSTSPRTVQFKLADGDGAISLPKLMQVNVVALDNAS